MREIRFRAWDKRKKCMYYITKLFNYRWFEFLYRGFWNLKGGDVGGEEVISSSRDGLLMQYTGLKDKNGKEIYEGDIVKEVFPVLDTNPQKYRTRILEVRFSDFGFTPFHWHHDWELKEQTHEVIGNIYENPEFLR